MNADAGAWSYRAGDWYAVFGTRTTLLLPGHEKERVIGLWALVDDGAGFSEVLDGLLAQGLSALSGFVLVGSEEEGTTKVLLRGEGVLAEVEGAEESATLEGTAGATWVERTLRGVTSLRVDLGPVGDGPDLRIEQGLVRVASVQRPAATAPSEATGGNTGYAAEPGPLGAPPPPPEPPAWPAPEPAAPADDDTGADTGTGTDIDEAEQVPPVEDVPEPQEAWQPEPDPEQTLDEDVLAADTGAPAPEDAPAPPPPPFEPWPESTDGIELEDTGDGPLGDLPDAGPSVPGEAPETMHLPPVPPPPPSFGDLPPPPPPQPGPWGDGGFSADPPPSAPGTAEQHTADPHDVDHDGLTRAGVDPVDPGELEREQSGVPGQPATPSVTGSVAKLLVSSGDVIDVDRVVLLGRAPEARRFTSTEQPLLVTVPSPMHEISSTHVEVRPGTGADHGSAVVTDMGSTNGTLLIQPGLPPEELKPGIAVQLIPGAIINLGDGLTIQVTRP